MSSTSSPKFVLMLITMLVSLSLLSQTTKEAVILYNTRPVLAEITTNGDVNKIIKEDPDYLKGFILKVQDYGQFIDATAAKKTATSQPTITTQPVIAANIDFLNIPFEKGFATLTDKAVDKLDDVLKFIASNPGKKLVLRTLSKDADSVLSLNRISSVKTYLKIKGLSPDLVRFETLIGDTDLDEVKITVDL